MTLEILCILCTIALVSGLLVGLLFDSKFRSLMYAGFGILPLGAIGNPEISTNADAEGMRFVLLIVTGGFAIALLATLKFGKSHDNFTFPSSDW